MNTLCILLLDDGSTFPGVSFGAPPPSLEELRRTAGQTAPRAIGEVVFCTAMSGYHEVLTDPSYTGQVVVMTYPHIGNYGCDDEWSEAGDAGVREVSPAALVVRNVYTGPVPGGRATLPAYLEEHRTPGITNIDTRRLTLHLRDHGARNGLIVRAGQAKRRSCGRAALGDAERRQALELLHAFPTMLGRSLVDEVGTPTFQIVNPGGSPHLALLDCGAKQGIVRRLHDAGCRITLLPSASTIGQLSEVSPDALFVSNGPGDPATLHGQVNLIAGAIGTMPVLGICLGHQLIARAIGAKTYKMAFGHHGINHPVRDRETGRVFVTSQNHGFAVDGESLPDGCRIWFDNANDGSVEGLRHEELRICTTQFHPEAAPGPHDSHWIFDEFVQMATGGSNAGAS